MTKVLIIETQMCTPHAETSIEIGLRYKLGGCDVVYAPIFHIVKDTFWHTNIKGLSNNGVRDDQKKWLNYLFGLVKGKFEFDFLDFDPSSSIDFESFFQNGINIDYEGFNIESLARSNIAQIFSTSRFDEFASTHKDYTHALAVNIVRATEVARYLIEKNSPDVVVLFNGRTTTTFGPYKLCKRLGIECVLHERGTSKDKFIMVNEPFSLNATINNELRKFVQSRYPDKSMLAAPIFYHRQKYGFNKMFSVVNRQAHDDFQLPDFLSENFAVYFTSSNYEQLFMPDQSPDVGLGDQANTIHLVAEICRQRNIQLAVKLHPRTIAEELESYQQFRKYTNVVLIDPTSKVSSHELAKRAFRNFSYGSTITWELLYEGTHCAVLGDSMCRGLPGDPTIQSVDELVAYFSKPLPSVDRSLPIKFGDFFLNYGEEYEFYNAKTMFEGEMIDMAPADDVSKWGM